MLRVYEDGDLEQFHGRLEDLSVPAAYTDFAISHSDMFTYIVDGEPAAIFGFLNIGMGTANCWARIGDRIRGHGFAFTRSCQHALATWSEANHIYLIQCLVEADNREYQRWIELSGFSAVHGLYVEDKPMLVYEKRWRYLQS